MQWKIDQSKEVEMRQWLHFEVDQENRELFIVLASQEMLRTAKRWGNGQAIYCDATHGMQRYSLKTLLLQFMWPAMEGPGTTHTHTSSYWALSGQ
jgi:hypothetical protein